MPQPEEATDCTCPKHAKKSNPDCPDCGAPLGVLLLFGEVPEYFSCQPCKRLYDPETLARGPMIF